MPAPPARFPDLPEAYVAHLVRPRHIGDLAAPHAAGEAGSMVGGLGVRVSLRFAEREGRVVLADVCGRAFGSAVALPVLSALAQAARGRDAEAARAIGSDALLARLGAGGSTPLPARLPVAAGVALTALRSALGDPDAGPPADPHGPGLLVCRCLGVGDRTVRAAIRAGATTPEALGAAVRACTGCRSCRLDLLALIHEETGAALPPPDPARPPAERVALSRGAAVLRGLGWPLQDARLAADTVRLTLGPAPARPETRPEGAAAIVRHLLRETLWEGAQVALGNGAEA